MTNQDSFPFKLFFQSILICIVPFALASCHFNTTIYFAHDKDNKYVKDSGYIISCNVSDNELRIGTYTPESWSPEFYYDYLKGIKTYKKIKIQNIKLKLEETTDTLKLKEVRNEREYIYSSPNLETIIDKNGRIQIIVSFKEENSDLIKRKQFNLTKFKSTYSTGTFPHS